MRVAVRPPALPSAALLALAASVALLLLGLAPAPATAQAPPEPTVEDAEDIETGTLTYDPEGRRDPFRPLTGEAPAEEERSQYAGTLRGLLWDQAKLTAILRTPSGPVAMFEGGAEKKGYTARVGDRFWNGVIYEIDYTTATVTVREELDDPRLLKPYRDHPLPLHPNEPQVTRGGRAPRERR